MANRGEKWYNDGVVLRQFMNALINAEILEEVQEFGNFLEKPWKWNTEKAAWDSNGSPQDNDDEGWEEWVDTITEEGGEETGEDDDENNDEEE